MHSPSAQPAPQSLGPEDPARDAVLRVATAPLTDVLGDRVRVEVQRLDRVGTWVFLLGRMRSPSGDRPNFSGTAYERQAAAGQLSDRYVALVKGAEHSATDWQLRAHAIGPTDVAWETWPKDHEAPSSLFG